MQYLMIQNPGVAPIEGYTVLGVSTSRGRNDLLGQFGSGSKMSVNVLLRKNLSPVVFCGLTKLEFVTEQRQMKGVGSTADYNVVQCKISGKLDGKSVKRTVDTGFALEYGESDWTDLSMALRELISNAIDATVQVHGTFEHEDLVIKVVDNVRAKDECTRVFIPFTDDVLKFYSELKKRYLHFADSSLLTHKILERNSRNLKSDKSPMIYRDGVFVREIDGVEHPTLFDYNFSANELKLDESRNVDDYSVRSAIARVIRDAPPHILSRFFIQLIKHQEFFENSLDAYYLRADSIYGDKQEEIRANWKKAWEIATGSADAVLCEPTLGVMEAIRRRGKIPVSFPSDSPFLRAAKHNGIPHYEEVLEEHELDGEQRFTATTSAVNAVDVVWKWMEVFGWDCGKEKPKVQCFHNPKKTRRGYYKDGVVYLDKDEFDGGINTEALKTALEECVHHATGYSDESRQLQEFLLSMVVDVLK